MAQQYKETADYLHYLREYNQLAKKADRRLRELERFSRYDEFSNILQYAYARAKRDIDQWTPPGVEYEKPRFQRNTPADTRSLKAKINDIKNFLNMPTSTMSGIKKIYKKRATTINKRYGTKLSWQQLATFFESGGLADKSFGQYGSKTVLRAIGKIQQVSDKVVANIKADSENNIKLSNDIAINTTINSLLSEHGTSLEELLN